MCRKRSGKCQYHLGGISPKVNTQQSGPRVKKDSRRFLWKHSGDITFLYVSLYSLDTINTRESLLITGLPNPNGTVCRVHTRKIHDVYVCAHVLAHVSSNQTNWKCIQNTAINWHRTTTNITIYSTYHFILYRTTTIHFEFKFYDSFEFKFYTIRHWHILEFEVVHLQGDDVWVGTSIVEVHVISFHLSLPVPSCKENSANNIDMSISTSCSAAKKIQCTK